jgi:hypothetical protein
MVVIPNRVRVVVVVSALALAAGLLTLTLLGKPAQAQAETVTDTFRDAFTFETGGRFDNGGCSEIVFIEGTLHTVSHTTIHANGDFHTKFLFNLKGQGEGLSSGDKYVYNLTSGFNVNATGPFTRTSTRTFKITQQGSATATDDLQGKVLFHVTVNANGEVTTVVDQFEVACT